MRWDRFWLFNKKSKTRFRLRIEKIQTPKLDAATTSIMNFIGLFCFMFLNTVLGEMGALRKAFGTLFVTF